MNIRRKIPVNPFLSYSRNMCIFTFEQHVNDLVVFPVI